MTNIKLTKVKTSDEMLSQSNIYNHKIDVAIFSAAIGVMLWGYQMGEETIEGRLVLAAGAFALFISHRLNRRLCESCPEDDHVARS